MLATYFDGLHFADPERLAKVFHPRALYATADEQPPLFRDLPSYLRIVGERQSPASRGEARKDTIDAIEFAGDRTARATVRCSIGPRDFVDFLTLVRVQEGWRIVSKVFQIIEAEADGCRT